MKIEMQLQNGFVPIVSSILPLEFNMQLLARVEFILPQRLGSLDFVFSGKEQAYLFYTNTKINVHMYFNRNWMASVF